MFDVAGCTHRCQRAALCMASVASHGLNIMSDDVLMACELMSVVYSVMHAVSCDGIVMPYKAMNVRVIDLL